MSKTITREYTVYKFSELSDKGREKAIEDFNHDSYENTSYWDYVTYDQGALKFTKEENDLLVILGIELDNIDEDSYLSSFKAIEDRIDSTSYNNITITKTDVLHEQFNNEEFNVHWKTLSNIEDKIRRWILANEYMPDTYIINQLEQYEEDGTVYLASGEVFV